MITWPILFSQSRDMVAWSESSGTEEGGMENLPSNYFINHRVPDSNIDMFHVSSFWVPLNLEIANHPHIPAWRIDKGKSSGICKSHGSYIGIESFLFSMLSSSLSSSSLPYPTYLPHSLLLSTFSLTFLSIVNHPTPAYLVIHFIMFLLYSPPSTQ